MSASGGYGPAAICAGIVGHANLLLGEGRANRAGSGNRRRPGALPGIRILPRGTRMPRRPGMYARDPRAWLLDPDFSQRFCLSRAAGLSFDAWLFHPQIGELTDLARAFPDTRSCSIICGGPDRHRQLRQPRDEIFSGWKHRSRNRQMSQRRRKTRRTGDAAIGYDFHERPLPPSSEEAAVAWRPYIETCIEALAPSAACREQLSPRQGQCSYQVIFNAFNALPRHIARREDALFSKTATDFLSAEIG